MNSWLSFLLLVLFAVLIFSFEFLLDWVCNRHLYRQKRIFLTQAKLKFTSFIQQYKILSSNKQYEFDGQTATAALIQSEYVAETELKSDFWKPRFLNRQWQFTFTNTTLYRNPMNEYFWLVVDVKPDFSCQVITAKHTPHHVAKSLLGDQYRPPLAST